VVELPGDVQVLADAVPHIRLPQLRAV
jgi:hypothetical protein